MGPALGRYTAWTSIIMPHPSAEQPGAMNAGKIVAVQPKPRLQFPCLQSRAWRSLQDFHVTLNWGSNFYPAAGVPAWCRQRWFLGLRKSCSPNPEDESMSEIALGKACRCCLPQRSTPWCAVAARRQYWGSSHNSWPDDGIMQQAPSARPQ